MAGAVIASSCFLLTVCNKEELENIKKELEETKKKMTTLENTKASDLIVKFFEYAFKNKIEEPSKGAGKLLVEDQAELDGLKKTFNYDLPDTMKKLTLKTVLDAK